MTLKTVDEMDGKLNDDVAAFAREWDDEHHSMRFHWEIPEETNGWIHYGDMGAPAQSTNWADTFPNPNEAIGVSISPTHPRDESCDRAEVFHVSDMDNKIDSRTDIKMIEGEPYRTPLYVRKRIFWQAVEAAFEWMENNPTQSP